MQIERLVGGCRQTYDDWLCREADLRYRDHNHLCCQIFRQWSPEVLVGGCCRRDDDWQCREAHFRYRDNNHSIATVFVNDKMIARNLIGSCRQRYDDWRCREADYRYRDNNHRIVTEITITCIVTEISITCVATIFVNDKMITGCLIGGCQKNDDWRCREADFRHRGHNHQYCHHFHQWKPWHIPKRV